MSLVWGLLSLRPGVDTAQVPVSGRRPLLPLLVWVQVDNGSWLNPFQGISLGQKELHCLRSHGNLGRSCY